MGNANDPFDAVRAPGPVPLGSGDDIYPITPDDDNDLPTAVRALRAGTDGNIQVTMKSGSIRVLAFLAGETRYGRFVRVWKANTTVGAIEGSV